MEQEVSSSKRFMLLRDGSQIGPLSASELQIRAREGAISPLDSVCIVGSDKWVLGYQVKGLFPAWLAAEIKERLADGKRIDDLLPPNSVRNVTEGERVVVLVVDGDDTSCSRRFIAGLRSEKQIDVVALDDVDTARRQARAGSGHVLVIVNEGFEEGVQGGVAIPIAVEEYVPDLLKKQNISMQSLIVASAQAIQSATSTVATGDQSGNIQALKNRKQARMRARRRMQIEWMFVGLFGVLGIGAWVLWVYGPPHAISQGPIEVAIAASLASIALLFDIGRGFRTRCEQCRLHWGYRDVERVVTGYSRGVRHTRKSDYINVRDTSTGSFRQYWVDRPASVETETEFARVYEQCRGCSHQRVRDESRQYDL